MIDGGLEKNTQPRILETVVTEVEKTLSVKEASETTGYSDVYITKLINEKKIKAVKGERGRWQIKVSELERWMNTRGVKPKRAEVTQKFDKPGQPEKTIHTRLAEALDEISKLKANQENETARVKKVVQELRKQNADQKDQIVTLEKDIEFCEERIEEHKATINQYREQERGHIEFMQTLAMKLTGSS